MFFLIFFGLIERVIFYRILVSSILLIVYILLFLFQLIISTVVIACNSLGMRRAALFRSPISVSVRRKSTLFTISFLFFVMAACSHTLCCLMCPRASFYFSIRSYLSKISTLKFSILFADTYSQSSNRANLAESQFLYMQNLICRYILPI